MQIDDKYRALIDRFVTPAPPRGNVELFVSSYITKCGVPPPLAMFSYVMIAGQLVRINTAHDRILSVSEYISADGMLVFYESAQRDVVWGFDYFQEKEDPPVYQTDATSRRWKREYASMSDFLVSMFYQQAINGGFPFGGNLISNAPLRIGSHWKKEDLIEHGNSGGLEVYYRPRQLVCLSTVGGRHTLDGAAATRSDFEDLTRDLGVEWLGTWEEKALANPKRSD